MTSLLEKAISVIAPHHCFLCSKENNVLCAACFVDVFEEPHVACFLCNKPSRDSAVCPDCAKQTSPGHVWMAAIYDGTVRTIIKAYKFDRLRAAYQPLAQAMLQALPYLPSDVVVTHIPTAPSRVRSRGYDQSLLLARAIAKDKPWAREAFLWRRHSGRQVGASRAARARQAAQAFGLLPGAKVAGKHVLLVDDVTTSGATLQAASKLLLDAGAARVDAVVVAKHLLR